MKKKLFILAGLSAIAALCLVVINNNKEEDL